MKSSPFLGLAETRAAHLRQLSHHMRALGWDTASLTDVEREIPELDSAMAVYRRLHAVPAAEVPDPATPAGTAVAAARAKAPGANANVGARRSTARRPTTRRAALEANPPSFKEFALKHLDALTKEVGVDSPGATAKALALARIQRVPNGSHRR